MRHRGRLSLGLLCLVFLTTGTLQPAPVSASFPGSNGLIAYTRATGYIWLVNPDGTYATKITHEGGRQDGRPAFTADGTQIVFTRWVGSGGGYPNIFKMEADGSGVVQLTNTYTTILDSPKPSPMNDKIAFAREWNIWLMNLDGSNEVQITTTNDVIELHAWRPDGGAILFTTIDPRAQDGQGDINELDLATDTRRQLTSAPGYESRADYSPDGKRIAFIQGSNPNDAGPDLRIMNADGSDNVSLGVSDAKAVAWAPDGQGLLVQRGDGPEVEESDPRLELIDPDTGESEVIFRDWFGLIAWQPCQTDCTLSTRAPSEIGAIYPYPKGMFVSVILEPFHVGSTVRITLLRTTGGSTERVFSRNVKMLNDGQLRTDMPQMRSGRCKIVARFGGDEDHFPSRAARSFGCKIFS